MNNKPVINFEENIGSLTDKMVNAFEEGMHYHLGRSISYSPFRLFFKIFTSANPKLMTQVKQRISHDIKNSLNSIPGFTDDIFFDKAGYLTPKGKKLMKTCHKFSIFFFKKKINAFQAFQLIKNNDFRMKKYQYFLASVNKFTLTVINR